MSSHGGTEDRVTSRGVSGVGERGVSGGRLSSRKGGRSSAARHSRLAKYTSHHLPDVSSRCASAVVSSQCGSIVPVCVNSTVMCMYTGDRVSCIRRPKWFTEVVH